jgi:hypothetical protein
MKIKYFILLFIIFFISLALFGCNPAGIGSDDYGTAQINGYVMDVSTKLGMSDVKIITSPAYDTIKTNAKGSFYILNFHLTSNPQDIIIIAEKDGYKSGQVNAKLKTDETSTVTILMDKIK